MKATNNKSIAPTTTTQEDLTTAGQRRINLIWEWTQSAVTVIVVITNMVVVTINALHNHVGDHPAVLSSSLFLILGFYYSRTNHQAIGGTGNKANIEQKYEGR